MSAIICQGLQSRHEPQLVEKRVLTLRLASSHQKIDSPDTSCENGAPPMPQCHDTEVRGKSYNNVAEGQDHSCGWSSIYSLTNTREGSCYHPPPLPKPLPTLSKKSLEFCTEKLGSETGSDIVSEENFFSSHLTNSKTKSPPRWGSRKNEKNGFPPPLTSITGQDRIRVKPCREGGRLVLKAVPIPSPPACFQVERTEGHLRLRFLSKAEASDKEQAEEEEEEDEEVQVSIKQAKPVEAKEKEDVENEMSGDASTERRSPLDIDGNESIDEGEMGKEHFQRLSRCKEGGNKRLVNWEPCWVATS